MLWGKEKTVHPAKSSIRRFFKAHLICCKGFWLGLYLVVGGWGLGEEIRLVICKNSDWWSVISGVSKGPLQYLDRVFCLSHLSTILPWAVSLKNQAFFCWRCKVIYITKNNILVQNLSVTSSIDSWEADHHVIMILFCSTTCIGLLQCRQKHLPAYHNS